MRDAHPREQAVGMAWYVSDADGVGGQLKAIPEDFRVREIERFDTQPVDADRGDYPHLVLRVTLHGWDTTQFAGELADRMSASRERVDWAGTKDKEAVTTQLFSVRDADPADLPDVDGADIDVVGRAGRGLQFGDLLGNEFEVVVRDPAHPERVDEVTADLAVFAGTEEAGAGTEEAGAGTDEAGAGTEEPDGTQADPTVAVPNYFGQQRFGSRRPVTHEVGLALARDDWKGAVLAYVGNPNEAEPEGTREARQFVEETTDWAGALERFPKRLGYERAMLHRLDENGGETAADFREALEAVPTNLQRLFVHAAQSYVFNRILSERLERGLPFDRPVAGDVACFADTEADTDIALPDTDRLQEVTESRVRSITRHCERGRAFVTAPLVGTETDLAEGEPGDVERAVLDELAVEPGDFDLPGEFHSTGTRRAISVRTNLSVERDPLTVSFALPKGSYATVLLREYLKVDPLEMG